MSVLDFRADARFCRHSRKISNRQFWTGGARRVRGARAAARERGARRLHAGQPRFRRPAHHRLSPGPESGGVRSPRQRRASPPPSRSRIRRWRRRHPRGDGVRLPPRRCLRQRRRATGAPGAAPSIARRSTTGNTVYRAASACPACVLLPPCATGTSRADSIHLASGTARALRLLGSADRALSSSGESTC